MGWWWDDCMIWWQHRWDDDGMFVWLDRLNDGRLDDSEDLMEDGIDGCVDES